MGTVISNDESVWLRKLDLQINVISETDLHINEGVRQKLQLFCTLRAPAPGWDPVPLHFLRSRFILCSPRGPLDLIIRPSGC